MPVSYIDVLWGDFSDLDTLDRSTASSRGRGGTVELGCLYYIPIWFDSLWRWQPGVGGGSGFHNFTESGTAVFPTYLSLTWRLIGSDNGDETPIEGRYLKGTQVMGVSSHHLT